MLINTPTPPTGANKEIKVMVPIRLHLRLHALKLIHGVQISHAVAEAIEEYFAALDRRQGRE